MTMRSKLLVAAGVIALVSVDGIAIGAGDKGKFCTKTAKLVFDACRNSVKDDDLIARAICLNVSDPTRRDQCNADAKDSRDEATQLCRDQHDTRRDACKLLGETRYDPQFNPADFDTDYSNPTHPNPYFPVKIGDKWEYHGNGEIDRVEIVNETKLIEGVRCVVARDQVFVNNGSELHEDTDDWYCQAKSGDVNYFGEETKDFETFIGDNPMRDELVSIDGSFKHGREGDKGGLIFPIAPTKDQVYVEEASLGNAEDVTVILSTTYDASGSDPELDQLVPKDLAQLLCANADCIVTKNFSLLEPGLFARKYFAKGIGTFLEVENVGTISQLVSCTLDPPDPRCGMLPQVP